MTYANLGKKTREDYEDLDEISKSYPLEWDGNVIRFKANRAVKYAVDHINLNDLFKEARRNDWPEEELKMFYRMMGYSLCGFMDVFPAKEKE